ncbi:cation diffusion facilitator family transporter [Populibacterium corticicola]|uniref:Cation diffusion facilitator family transporter n=1 Tax=Populibacterium corticicola TaxID=1812826 RepID=A0ABW5XCD0_9MICO
MAHDHSQHSNDHGHAHVTALTAGAAHKKPLIIALGLTATFMVVELIVGFSINSLALISDGAHMGTDVIGLTMALVAIALANRKTTSDRTFGFYRIEVLAALANGLLLFGVAGYVVFEAVERFREPTAIPSTPLLVTAVLGLIVNIISFRLLAAGSKESINLKGASLEVLGDLIGSVGVILAAILLYFTGWNWIDPVIGVAVGLFILPRTWVLMRQALRILIEAAPKGLDVDTMRARITQLDGVNQVHDLHVWTITSGLVSASAHVVMDTDARTADVLPRVLKLLEGEYGIDHATVQCEPGSASGSDGSLCGHDEKGLI